MAEAAHPAHGHSHRVGLASRGHGKEPCDYLSEHKCDIKSDGGIDSVESLRTHLKWAIKIELTTIPAYLFALFSLKESPKDFKKAIKNVAVEEMLHMSLAANLLIAVGGEPRLLDTHVVPSYPTLLPMQNSGIVLHLKKVSVRQLESFMSIEKPADAGSSSDCYSTIGQFYQVPRV
jgi:Ferritin-like